MTYLFPAVRSPFPHKFAPFFPLFGFLLITVLFTAISLTVFKQMENLLENDKVRDLATVADLKVAQIADWQKGQLHRSEIFLKNSLLPAEFEKWLKEGMPQEGRERMLWVLVGMQYAERHKVISLFDKSGRAMLSTCPDLRQDADDVAMAREAMRTRQVSMSDFHRAGEHGETIRIDVVAPLMVSGAHGSRVVGAVVFQIDPRDFLYPLIKSWPTVSRSAETLLVRRDGDEVTYLNDLRHRKDTALSFHLPLSTPDLPAAMGVLGARSVVDGADYRGARVVAAMRKVPDTSWFMVSKIDREEFLAPILKLRQWSMAVSLAVALIGGLLVFSWLKSYQANVRYLEDQRDAARERELLVKHFELLNKHANDMILVADESTRIIEANDRFQAALGYTRDELLNMRIADLHEPEQFASFVERELAVLMATGELRVEEVFLRKDGTTFPVDLSGRVIEVQGKRYLQAILRDITERKLAQDALRKSEARLQASQRMAHIGSWELDLVENVLSWSAENYRIFEIDPTLFDASYEVFLAAVHPDDRERVSRTYSESVKNRTSYSVVHRLLLPGQRVKYVREWCDTVYDGNGNPLRSVGTTQDITEHNLAELEYRAILQATTDGFLVVDAHDGRFLDVNRAYSRMIGYSQEELGRMGVADVDANESPEQVRQHNELIRQNGSALFEARHRRKNGGLIDVEVSVHYIEIRGGIFIAFIRDITERKLIERKVKHLNDLYSAISRANEAIVRFKDQRALLDEICRIAVEYGHFKLAWIGLVDEATQWVTVAAASGESTQYLDTVRVSIDADKPEGRGPTGSAIRENQAYVVDDFFNDARTLPWHENARKHGLRASASFPMEFEGRPVGALTVYADESNYFDQELTMLLGELCRDISFALDNFAREERRMAAEETVRLSEEKFRTLVANLPQKVFVKDANSVYSTCNALYAADVGIEPEDIAGKTDFDFHPRELAEKYIADDVQIIRSGQAKSFEEAYLLHGQTRFVHTTKAPVKDALGRIVGVIGVFWDITEIKQAAAEQRKAAEIIEDLYNNAPCGYHSLDPDGVIIHMNQTELRWLGYTAEELIGKVKIADLYSKRSGEVFADNFALLKAHGSLQDIEVEIICKDGRMMTVLLNASGVYDAEGHYLMNRATLFDISDRKLAEKKLFESEQRFRAMADNAPIIIWMASAGAERMYTGCGFFNQRWHDFSGLALDASQGYNWLSIVHPEDQERCLEAYIDAFEHAREFQVHYRLRRKDGDYRWMEDTGVPRVPADGVGVGFIGTCIDITDRKLIEVMRAEVEHIGRLNIAGEMASGLAHELSQPLTAASNYLKGCLFRMDTDEWDREDVRKAVRLAYLQTERAGAVINHLKALIRKQGREPALFDVNALIEDSLDFIAYDIQQHSIRVIRHFSDLPPVSGNRIEIEQVLLNLMKNAIDSMESTPRRTLSLSTTMVDSGDIMVTVSDTGTGIPSANLDQVFNPFQTSKQNGLGLGLAICRSLVENHAGRIWAEQNDDVGTKFNFTLPKGIDL